ncbi:MAG: mechanosensitive ion channel [Opitutaceae bacterium]|nr:mechanosensitive ion channel [Opitutaceae bacterium]
MNELVSGTGEAANLLGIAVAVYVVAVVIAKVLYRTRGVRFRWIYHGFAAALGLLAGALFALPPGDARSAAVDHLLGATLLLGSFPLATLVNHFLWTRSTAGKPVARAPRLLSDTTTLVFFGAMLLIVLQFVYGQEVPGLLAGSGVAAIVLGLAMQDLLSNTIAGLALFIEKPFKTGDWLKIGDDEAKVVEVTWRSVRLITDDDVFLDVPNSKVVQESIVNFHQPDPKHSVKVEIGLHYDVPPVRAISLLREAALAAPHACKDPLPSVWLKSLGDSAVIYEIEVWIEDHAHFKQVTSDVRTNCWYAARRAGMEIPYPQLTVHRGRTLDTSAVARAAANAALAGHPVFGFLSQDQIGQIVARSPAVLFAPSERLTLQGEPGGSMFVLTAGRVEVVLEKEGTCRTMAALGPGACVGEMSVLTGAPRTATVVAQTEVEAIEIGKPAFAELIQGNPEVVNRLSALLAERQLANEQASGAADSATSIEQVRRGILGRIRSFFQLTD